MKIIVADDHEIIASGIESFLKGKDESFQVYSAVNYAQLKNLLEKDEYNVLIQDIRFGNDDARTFLKEIQTSYPELKIIALSSHVDEFTVKSTLAAGCKGYVSKSASVSEIFDAIQSVLENKQFISSDINSGLITNFVNSTKALKLTKREQEVLIGIHDELSTKEIAEKLFLSEKTIEGYRSSLFMKFEVKNVAGLVKQAILYGYV